MFCPKKNLILQGDGDYDGVANLVAEKGNIGAEFRSELDRLRELDIPVSPVFEQGVEVMGL